MRFLRRPKPASRCIAVFCGAFHPPTVAHAELARAARNHVDEVLWVMPESFPHKNYENVSLPGRLRVLLEASQDAVAVSSESLFFSIAAEAEQSLPGKQIRLLIGEDGARRLLEWNYGFDAAARHRYLSDHLRRYPILTARRQEQWQLPAEWEACFNWLDVDPAIGGVSSSMVRQRMASGEPWREWVPATVRNRVAELYASGGIVKGQ